MRAIRAAAALGLAVAAVGLAGGCRQILGIDDRKVAEKSPIDLPTADEIAAANAIAESDCTAMEACVPVSFHSLFANHAECVKEDAVFWAAHFFGPDSGATPQSVKACATSVPTIEFVQGKPQRCDAWATWNLVAGPAGCSRLHLSTCPSFAQSSPGPAIPDCYPLGARAIGAPCGSGAQCSTGLCSFGQQPGEPCGTCLASAGLGKTCGTGISSAWCDTGQGCGGTCATLGTEAFDSCLVMQGCGPENVCFGGACKPLKQAGAENCVATAAGPPTTETCDMDLACNTADMPSHCEAPTEVPLGGRCGNLDVAGGPIGICAHGARCEILVSGGGARCVPAIPLGAHCTTAVLFGDSCEYPGMCIGGICEPRGPRACPSGAL